MRVFRRIAGGFSALLPKTRVEQELDAELREYLEAAVEEKMRRGLSREAASRAARVELGSIEAVKDRVRDAGWESLADSVWQDVRYGARTLRRSPGFTVTTIGILALGIGANTAIFTLLNAVMLRTLPVRAPQQLVEPLSKYPADPRMNGFLLGLLRARARSQPRVHGRGRRVAGPRRGDARRGRAGDAGRRVRRRHALSGARPAAGDRAVDRSGGRSGRRRPGGGRELVLLEAPVQSRPEDSRRQSRSTARR